MMKKLFFGILLIMLLIIPVQSAIFTGYTYNATETSLHFYFDTDLKTYDLYYNNELVLYNVSNEAFLPHLEPDTDYSFVISNGTTNEIQIVTGHTLSEETTEDEFYLQYGLIGLFVIIIVCLYIAMSVYYVALVSILMSFIGFGYCVSHEYGFMTTFLFIVLFIASIMVYAIRRD